MNSKNINKTLKYAENGFLGSTSAASLGMKGFVVVSW